MPKEIDTSMLAPCGMNCNACFRQCRWHCLKTLPEFVKQTRIIICAFFRLRFQSTEIHQSSIFDSLSALADTIKNFLTEQSRKALMISAVVGFIGRFILSGSNSAA
ncbi:hypothetical protein [Treponema pedis]|uniref:hypothetical protein n=1 Tax=Treponema pedis TaxID=409322 RepID=UPI001268BA95|nr:hypothetical protein [Treponema pedis]